MCSSTVDMVSFFLYFRFLHFPLFPFIVALLCFVPAASGMQVLTVSMQEHVTVLFYAAFSRFLVLYSRIALEATQAAAECPHPSCTHQTALCASRFVV